MRTSAKTLTPLLALLLCACSDGQRSETQVPASEPESSTQSSIEAWSAYQNSPLRQPKPLARGMRGAISGTTGGPAVGAGLEILKRGGSAADAALATSLGQIALAAGSWVSYAGVMVALYYDAETGQVQHMNAGWNTFLGEDDPLSIPFQPEPSGRSAMVGGFMAGVQAMHDRYGKLPFADIFEPAIYYAETGFEVNELVASLIKSKEGVLSRTPAGREFITDANDKVFAAGDRFVQPETAETLRQVAANGAGHMYEGPWGQRFVELVQAEGGKVSMEDMERYEVIWSEPLSIEYRDYELLSSSESHYLLGAFNLLSAAGLTELGHYSDTPEVFVGFQQIFRATGNLARQAFGPGTVPDSDWLDKQRGSQIWRQVSEGSFPLPPSSGGTIPKGYAGHSDAVVAVDQWGNVAVLTHSINTGFWGTTGIVVDGVVIADAASYQQGNYAAIEPGARIWSGILPAIVMREGRPVAGLSSIGGGLYEETVKVLANLLDYGMDTKQANDAPSFLLPTYITDEGFGISKGDAVIEGDFTDLLLADVRELGRDVQAFPYEQVSGQIGYVVNLGIDPITGEYTAAVSRFGWGQALAY